jgi:hypothetical protein
MLLYHSCQHVHQIQHLLSLVEQHCDDVVYATPFPQTDYGPLIVEFEGKLSDKESFDQGGISTWTTNVSLPASAINLETMKVIY